MPRQRPPLGATYHDLPFAVDADAFLESLSAEHWTIDEQLRRRNVVRLQLLRLLSGAGIGIENGAFPVYFNDVYADDHAELARMLGHELGHTFHIDASLSMEAQRPKTWGRPEARRERFCDSFGLRWNDVNGPDRVIEYVKNALTGVRIYLIPQTKNPEK